MQLGVAVLHRFLLYLNRVGPTFSNEHSFSGIVLDLLLMLVCQGLLLDTLLVLLHILLQLHVGQVGVLQGRVELSDVKLELLAHAHSLGLGLGLGLDGELHLLELLGVVAAGALELLLLLLDPLLDVGADLVYFQGQAEKLVLFLKFKNMLSHRLFVI